ncbi:beta transducin [Fusarium acutatum]|uniref:Beta transducin n=1 Tax=Fusarium acutatum TaxID=78861 RepID=A0A8H4JFE1_9HYPO|nr:beta transducin [Fusarium acutatum]
MISLIPILIIDPNSTPRTASVMRLVNTETIQIEFLADDNVPDYAILSHTWEQEEVLFHDMGRDSAKSKKGYGKLESCCRVARDSMIFFDKDWRELGTKTSLVQGLSQRTSIPESILCDSEELETTSIAQKMSWAADRVSTRKEDGAYSLMGIFGINMPLRYGEGDKAFYRLQEEIMRVSEDHSLFEWKAITSRGGLLAPTPAAFKHSGDIIPWNPFTPYNSPFTITNKGVHMEAPFIAQDTSGSGLCVFHFVERNGLSSLSEAALAGDSGSVWYLLTQIPSGIMHDEARSAICLAARGGHERLVSQLLARRDTSALVTDNESRTALSHAAECGQEAIVRFILSSARIHPDTRDKDLVSGNVGGNGDTQTALWHAISAGDLDLVKLLRNKASPSVGGEPALCAAVSRQHPAITALLLQHGAEPDERDSKRRSPLHIACREDNHEIVAILMRHGVNADRLDTTGKTELAFATLKGNVALVKMLLENGANPRAKCANGKTAAAYDGAGDEEFNWESEVV